MGELVDDKIMEIATMYFNNQVFPNKVQSLLKFISFHLANKFNMGPFILNGSFNSKTAVLGSSDIDILAVMNMEKNEPSKKQLCEAVFNIDSYLSSLCKHNIDCYLDPPAFRIRDLSKPYHIIEITPAIGISSVNIHTEDKEDYLILSKYFQSLISTNPFMQSYVSKYLNSITKNYFSYIVILIKLCAHYHQIPISSIAIEIFTYHWIRNTYQDGDFPTEEISVGTPNTSFHCIQELKSLVNCTIQVIRALNNQLVKSYKSNTFYEMINPYLKIRIPSTPFHISDTIEKQKLIFEEFDKYAKKLEEANESDDVWCLFNFIGKDPFESVYD